MLLTVIDDDSDVYKIMKDLAICLGQDPKYYDEYAESLA
jgi:hypothetical protein